jgi:hypothetical protein
MRPVVPFSLQPGDWMTVSFGRYAGIDGQVLEVQEVPPLVVRARLRVDFDENVWQPVWKEPMTEAEWLTTCDTAAMERYLFALPTPPSERKRRLFVCACARRVSGRYPDRYNRKAIKIGERFADGEVTFQEAWRQFETVSRKHSRDAVHHPAGSCFPVHLLLTTGRLQAACLTDVRRLALEILDSPAEPDAQRELFRDIFGNPFRSFFFDRSWGRWQGGLIFHLAQTIYEERRWDELSILADALEDAGCTDETILSHCRTPSLHARGCWLLDGLLGKP